MTDFVSERQQEAQHPQHPQAVRQWQVGDCRVDLDRQLMARAGKAVELRPKAWELLCLLLLRPNAVVRSDHLMDALWPRQQLLPKALVNLVSELRGRLGNAAVLQAVPRRGYMLQATPAGQQLKSNPAARLPSDRFPVQDSFVGRQHELGLWRMLAAEASFQGLRLLAVTGQAGVGKTTLVRQGAAELRATGWTVMSGQCTDAVGTREPLAPILQALREWARGGDEALRTLELCAPCWLAQLPGLMDAERGSRLRGALAEASTARIGTEAVALFQHLAASAPVALILEDLHWADAATLDMLMALLPAVLKLRVLVVLSWRTQELPPSLALLLSRLDAAPLNGTAEQCRLRCFSDTEVTDYVARRLPSVHLSGSDSAELTRMTAGLPLFLKLLCDENPTQQLAHFGMSAERPTVRSLASRLRKHVHERVARLPSDLRTLMEVTSCMTAPAPLPLLAQALESSEDTALTRCRTLEDLGLFERGPMDFVWSDNRVVPSYGLSHAVFREAVVERLMPNLRQALNRRIAKALQGAVDIPGSLLGLQLAQAYIGADMHVEAAQALQDTGSRWLGRFAREAALRVLSDALDHVVDADESQPEALKLRTLLCHRICQTKLFDFRSDNALHRRACTIWIDDTSRRVDAEGRHMHALAACMLHLHQGRSDLAQALVKPMVDAAQLVGRLQQAAAQSACAWVAIALGEPLSELQALKNACSLLSDWQGTPEWSPWIGMLQACMARALASSGHLAEFRSRLDVVLAPGLYRQTAPVLGFGLACFADALVQLGCHDAAAHLYQRLLASGKEREVEEGFDEAWLGLLACEPAGQRPLEELLHYVATISKRGPSRGDHRARLLIVDSLIERAQWNDARLELDAAEHVPSHWPSLRTEVLRLKGRLEMGLGRPADAQNLWQQALEIDTEKRNFPGALRCAELLGRAFPHETRAVWIIHAAFPDWLDAQLASEAFAPLAQLQRRHRAVLEVAKARVGDMAQ